MITSDVSLWVLDLLDEIAETKHGILEVRGVIMKVLRNISIYRSFGGIVVMLLMTISFQNCGKAGFDSDLGSQQDDASTDISLINKYGSNYAQKVQDIPFAYEVTFDTISFNSCAHNGLTSNSEKGGYYTLKAGAYTSKGGLRLNDTFFNYMADNFAPVYPNTTVTRDELKEYLSDSPINRKTQPILGIRSGVNLLTGYDKLKSTRGQGAALPMLSTLHSAEILETALNNTIYESYLNTRKGNGTYQPYFPFSTEYKTLETDLLWNSAPANVETFMDAFGASRMIIGFSVQDSIDLDVLNPNTGQSMSSIPKAYGRGYKLTFDKPSQGYINGVSGVAHYSNPRTVLAEIQEYDLMNNTTSTGTWSCDDPRKRLMVVRAADAQTMCPPMTLAQMETYRATLAVIRRHLTADKWDVNVALTQPCAVPKESISCYNENGFDKLPAGTPRVDYTLRNECFQDNANVTYPGATPNSTCAKFISFCQRN